MSVPRRHLELLETDLKSRARWLNTLRRTISALQDEVTAHETVLRVAGNKRVLQLLDDLAEGMEIDPEVIDNPRAFFLNEGVWSQDAPAPLLLLDPQSRRVEARFEVGAIIFGLVWSRKSGFQITRPPREWGLDSGRDDWMPQ